MGCMIELFAKIVMVVESFQRLLTKVNESSLGRVVLLYTISCAASGAYGQYERFQFAPGRAASYVPRGCLIACGAFSRKAAQADHDLTAKTVYRDKFEKLLSHLGAFVEQESTELFSAAAMIDLDALRCCNYDPDVSVE